MAAKTQVNSATLVMGVTGSGKSSLAYTLAQYLWETYQKVLYYYNCDGGGYPAKVQEGVALGIIKVFRMRTRDPGDLGLAFETCYRAAQGAWPQRINPSTGEVPPAVRMIMPITKKWEMRCANGHLVKTVPSQNLLTPQPCPACKMMVTKQEMQIQEVMVASKGFEDRGGVFFDGLSSMLSWELMEMGQRAGKMELKGEEAAIGGKIISGDMKFGGNTRSHVGFAQSRGEELAHLALGIPNLLVPPVFTALSMEATDEGALSIIGPKIAGRAKTDEAPQWFGNCLEAAKMPAETGAGEQFVLYLSEFTDAQGRRHLLKHRGAPGTMPDKLVDPPNNQAPFTEFNLGTFFKKLDDALQAGILQAQAIYPDAPGLPEGFVEFGEEAKIEQAPAAAGAQGQAPKAAAAPAAPPAAPKPAAAQKKAAATKPAAAPVPAGTPVAPATQPPAASSPAAPASTPAVAAPAVPAPVPASPPTPAAGTAPAAPQAKPAGGAPPPGRRPMPQAQAPQGPGGTAPVKPAAPVPATSQVAAGARPASAPVAPVQQAVARPPAAAPRPPAAAPRPQAAPPAPPQGSTPK